MEAEKGIDLGIVHLIGELVRVKRRAKGILYREEKKLLRKASAAERGVLDLLRLREKEAFGKCRDRICQHGRPMRLVDVEYQFDGNRVTFYYTADRTAGWIFAGS
ncbi:MAG: PSP1 domain-containing protein [Bacteroidota bacterium]